MSAAAVSEVVAAWNSPAKSDETINALCRSLCEKSKELRGETPLERAQVAMWQSYALTKKSSPPLDLRSRSYLVGQRMTLADVVVFLSCDGVVGPNELRWFRQIQSELSRMLPSLPVVEPSLSTNVDGPIPMPKKKKKAPAPPVEKEKKKKQKAPAAAAPADAPKKEKKAASADDDPTSSFAALDVRVGKIVDAWKHPDAEKLWCEKIDVGEAEPRSIASGLRHFYAEDTDLKGRMVLVFANLKPRTMQGFKSEGMVLCAANAEHTEVKFLEPAEGASPGDRVSLASVANLEPPATASQVQKKKYLEKVLPHLRTNEEGVACCGTSPFLLPGGGKVMAPLKSSPIS